MVTPTRFHVQGQLTVRQVPPSTETNSNARNLHSVYLTGHTTGFPPNTRELEPPRL